MDRRVVLTEGTSVTQREMGGLLLAHTCRGPEVKEALGHQALNALIQRSLTQVSRLMPGAAVVRAGSSLKQGDHHPRVDRLALMQLTPAHLYSTLETWSVFESRAVPVA